MGEMFEVMVFYNVILGFGVFVGKLFGIVCMDVLFGVVVNIKCIGVFIYVKISV